MQEGRLFSKLTPILNLSPYSKRFVNVKLFK